MSNEALIGIAALLFGILTYFVGEWRGHKRHDREGRDNRIRHVFDNYMGFRRSNYTGGYDGLLKSGIATLASNNELNELCERVVAHGEAHPLGSTRAQVFQGVDLLRLFKFAAEKKINLVTTPIEAVIRDSGAGKSGA